MSEPVEGIDYGPIRDADMQMLRHGLSSTRVEVVDFSEFCIEDEE